MNTYDDTAAAFADAIRAAYLHAPNGYVHVSSPSVTGRPPHTLTAPVVSVDGDTVTYALSSLWSATSTRGDGITWSLTAVAVLCPVCTIVHHDTAGEHDDIGTVLSPARVSAARAALRALGTIVQDRGLISPRRDDIECTACGDAVRGMAVFDYVPAEPVATPAPALELDSGARVLRDAVMRGERACTCAADAAALQDDADTYVDAAALHAARVNAPCDHWECALQGDGDTCTAPAPGAPAPRPRRTYTVHRVTEQFHEYVDADGMPADVADDSTFNVDATPHYTDIESLTFDSVADLIDAMRRDYVTFDATGHPERAGEPDGSRIIDYATGERESILWDLDGIPAALLSRVIRPAIDAR